MSSSPFYLYFTGRIDCDSAQELVRFLRREMDDSFDTLYLLISTHGGSVAAGFELYHLLRALPVKLITHNIGNVESIGNVPFLAGIERYACPETSFMFHGVSSSIKDGTTSGVQLRERLSSVECDEKRISAIVKQHTKLTEENMQRLFVEGEFLTTSEALEAGIIHAVKPLSLPAISALNPFIYHGACK